MILAHTKVGTLDGYPQIIVWHTQTRRKVSQIAIDDEDVRGVYFSNYSNMLLVISYDSKRGQSTVSVWDFLDGRREYFCKSIVPFEIVGAAWNPYLNAEADEFVTICKTTYHYWRITKTLQL